MSMSWATSFPDLVTPVRCRMIDGCRFVVAARSSCRSYAIRTGRPALRARREAWIARIEGYSSLPPNAPPVSSWTTTTRSRSSAERPHQGRVHVVRALQRAVDLDAPVVARDGDHRLRLEVELLLVPRPVGALDHQVGGGEAGLEVALVDLERLAERRRLERVEHRGQRLGPEADGVAGGQGQGPVRARRPAPRAPRRAGSRRRRAPAGRPRSGRPRSRPGCRPR